MFRRSWLAALALADLEHAARRQLEHLRIGLVALAVEDVPDRDADIAITVWSSVVVGALPQPRSSRMPAADTRAAGGTASWLTIALMTSLGLAAFVGLTGIQAGPVFLSALRDAGIGLLFGGVVVTLLPQIIGLLFGHFGLRMNPILLLGALTGARRRRQRRWLQSKSAQAARSQCWATRRPIRSQTSC